MATAKVRRRLTEERNESVYAYGSFGANNGPHSTGVMPATALVVLTLAGHISRSQSICATGFQVWAP